MPAVHTLTTAPVDLSATLTPGKYLVQVGATPFGMFYGAFPASEADPTDTRGMFYAESKDYFVVNVGVLFDPVWVAEAADPADFGVPPCNLIIQEAA